MKLIEVEFYETAVGTSPVCEFLDSLPPKAYRKAFWTLEVVQAYGRVSSQYFKALSGTDGLYEVRVTFSRNDLRLIGFFEHGNLLVLAHGFFKKSQQTPVHEITVAQDRRRDYLSRRRP